MIPRERPFIEIYFEKKILTKALKYAFSIRKLCNLLTWCKFWQEISLVDTILTQKGFKPDGVGVGGRRLTISLPHRSPELKNILHNDRV